MKSYERSASRITVYWPNVSDQEPWWCGPDGMTAVGILEWLGSTIECSVAIESWLATTPHINEFHILLSRAETAPDRSLIVCDGIVLCEVPVSAEIAMNNDLHVVAVSLYAQIIDTLMWAGSRLEIGPPALMYDNGRTDRTGLATRAISGLGLDPIAVVSPSAAHRRSLVHTLSSLDRLPDVVSGYPTYRVDDHNVQRGPAIHGYLDYTGMSTSVRLDSIFSTGAAVIVLQDFFEVVFSAGLTTFRGTISSISHMLHMEPTILGRDGSVAWCSLKWSQRTPPSP